MAIRWRINELLEKKGWSGYELAHRADMTPSAIYKLQKKGNVKEIDTVTLQRLARAFNVKNPFRLLEYLPDQPDR
ncbi:helix-turn-helix domain-containing protein [Humibacter sp.]|uniref:helix-turn-helix domain-containing protein n=1 Tax=Humibacter sp. TaxID=1940291 RepID=UPI003F7F7200